MSRRSWIPFDFRWRRPVHLRDVRPLVFGDEFQDILGVRHERRRQLSERRIANHDQQRGFVLDDGR